VGAAAGPGPPVGVADSKPLILWGPNLNLLYVGTLPPHRGGSAIVASYLLPALLQAGHRVRALAPLPANADGAVADAEFKYPELSITWFPVPSHSNSFSLGSTHNNYRRAEHEAIARSLPRLITRESPHVLILGRESVAWHAVAAAQQAGIPTLMLAHGGTTFASLATGSNQEPHFRLLQDLWRGVDQIVAVAAHLKRALRRLGLLNVTVIPNPVDVHRFSPGTKNRTLLRALGISPHDRVILHASNLRPVKRADDIIASAEITLKSDPRLLYIIVGDGPGRVHLEAQCRGKGIVDRFRFPGWIEHARMPEYLRLADIIVMPSESEGQSLVYLEAQACGRVLLASRIEGAREVIRDGETGFLFDTGNVCQLSAMTLRLAEAPLHRARIGDQAYKAAQVHAVDATAAKYTECLLKLIRRCRRPIEAMS
jgi:glycosyltransferase involved in cell wall biosynthesis